MKTTCRHTKSGRIHKTARNQYLANPTASAWIDTACQTGRQLNRRHANGPQPPTTIAITGHRRIRRPNHHQTRRTNHHRNRHQSPHRRSPY
jgi:hypothetical protein